MKTTEKTVAKRNVKVMSFGELKNSLGIETLGFRPEKSKVDPDTGEVTESNFVKAILWEEEEKMVVSTTKETLENLLKTGGNTRIVATLDEVKTSENGVEYRNVVFILDNTIYV